MVQSPSWAANWFVASQEIPRISLNPKVHYRTHKRPPPVPILGQPNPVHIPTSHLLEIHPNIIHPSTPRSPQWSHSFRFPHQDLVHPPLLTNTLHMTRPSHYSRYNHPHNIEISSPTKSYLHVANFAVAFLFKPQVYRILTAYIQVQGSVQAFLSPRPQEKFPGLNMSSYIYVTRNTNRRKARPFYGDSDMWLTQEQVDLLHHSTLEGRNSWNTDAVSCRRRTEHFFRPLSETFFLHGLKKFLGTVNH